MKTEGESEQPEKAEDNTDKAQTHNDSPESQESGGAKEEPQ